MLNFLSICEDDSVLSVILLSKRVLEIICIIVPVLLIIMTSIEVTKIVFNTDQKAVKGVMSRTVQKMIAAVAVFFIPTLVSLLLNLLGEANYSATACWTNANTTTIAAYKEARLAEEEAEQEELDAEHENSEQQRLVLEATREAVREENEEKAAEAAAAASANSSGTSSSLAASLIAVAQDLYNQHLSEPNIVAYTYGKISGYAQNGYDYPWCAAFVWYCSNESGVYPTKVSLKTASVSAYKSHFENTSGLSYQKSAYYGGSYTPKMGDYIFFSDNHSQSSPSHIGLVKGVSGSNVLIIDGNCSNTVCDRSKSLTDPYIIGYGVWE